MKRLLHLALMPSAVVAALYADAVLGAPDGCASCMKPIPSPEPPR